jgi:hypothetical protein
VVTGAPNVGLEPGVDTLRAVALARLAPRGVSSMVEQRTFNPWVLGSSPRRPTDHVNWSDSPGPTQSYCLGWVALQAAVGFTRSPQHLADAVGRVGHDLRQDVGVAGWPQGTR